jgi:hypothetical protein
MTEKYKLNREDLKKVGKGALIAAIGAVVTYLIDLIPSVDFGVWTPVAVAGFSILANFVRKWLSNTK